MLPTDAEVAGSPEGAFSFYGRAFDKPFGLRAFQNGWQASITARRTAAAFSWGASWPQAASKAPALPPVMKAIWQSFTHLSTASSDKRWAIRAVAARLDRLWVVSELAQTDCPPREPSSAARIKGPKRPLALADDNWGPWQGIGLADKELESLLQTSKPSEPSMPSRPSRRDDA